METSFPSTTLIFKSSNNNIQRTGIFPNPNSSFIHRNRNNKLLSKGVHKFPLKIQAINEVSSAADPVQAQVTWEIVVGTLAGVVPFVVAGIEFSKRIVAQKRCAVCSGSGLVRREKYYFRCPRCGGFLPWQSWKRFFSG